MSQESALFAILSEAGSDAGDRFYPERIPANPTFPLGTYFRVNEIRHPTRDKGLGTDAPGFDTAYSSGGFDTLDRVLFQIDLWGETYEETRIVETQIRPKLAGFSGTADGEDISNILIVATRDDFNDDTDKYRRMIDAAVWYT